MRVLAHAFGPRYDLPIPLYLFVLGGALVVIASFLLVLPHGKYGETHRESVVIDRAGRLQLPKEALESISFNGRAEIRIVNDHVELWPLGTGMNGFSLDGGQQAENQATRDEVN